MEEYINPIYLEYVKKDLNELKFHIANINGWSNQLSILEGEDLGYSAFEIKALRDKIESSEQYIKRIKSYFVYLEKEAQEIIIMRYITKSKVNVSFDNIAKKIHKSKSTVKRSHDESIKILALHKYQTIENTRMAQ